MPNRPPGGSSARRSARYPTMPAHSSGAACTSSSGGGQPVGVRLGHHGVLGVAAVGVPAGEPGRRAEVLAPACGTTGTARRCPAARRSRSGRRGRTAPPPPRGRPPCRRSRGRARSPSGVGAGRPRPGASRCGTRHRPGREPAPPPAPARGPPARLPAAGGCRSGPARTPPTRARRPSWRVQRRGHGPAGAMLLAGGRVIGACCPQSGSPGDHGQDSPVAGEAAGTAGRQPRQATT